MSILNPFNNQPLTFEELHNDFLLILPGVDNNDNVNFVGTKLNVYPNPFVMNNSRSSINIKFSNSDFSTGYTAYDIVYDVQNDETYFKVNVDRIKNPFDIDYSFSASTNLAMRELDVSPYRNLNNTYLDYCFSINYGVQSLATDFFKQACGHIFKYLKKYSQILEMLNLCQYNHLKRIN